MLLYYLTFAEAFAEAQVFNHEQQIFIIFEHMILRYSEINDCCNKIINSSAT